MQLIGKPVHIHDVVEQVLHVLGDVTLGITDVAGLGVAAEDVQNLRAGIIEFGQYLYALRHPVRRGVRRKNHNGALIEADALANYVLRLSGPALAESYAMAFVPDPPLPSGAAASEESLLRAARAIDQTFGAARHVMAHAGDGQILLIGHAPTLPDARAVASRLRDRLARDRASEGNPLHGLHVATGCLWLVVMLVQLGTIGLDKRVKVNLLRLGLFWHFLDIVWIAIFSVVYLQGLAR